MAQVTVNFNGLDARLKQIAKECQDFRLPLRQSSVYLEGSMSRRFSQGGGSKGKWKSLSPATIKRHPHRSGGTPLNDTGRLRSSVSSGAVKQFTPKRLTYSIGSNVKYASVHNFGSGRIPRREFMYTDSKDEREINKVFADYIRRIAQ
ncbi:phage virion morphogenesis protein [Bacillus phage Andromeda]|uniref:Phage virion morphogenesis protein n=3 Tax=Andromedavirus TaxID=1623275 RepID=M1IEK7_9CAUD|nr:tail completion or Neck1 protein [Bacillus phage Andromeda]YP_008770655.1 tail completion or Neck1 protein [Bacillus phage Glittering]AGE60858.1 phage virion morphogenesis protein [Bacillus phage Gemini]AGE61089.1 phage virion morphogenesis protein [Bacillus phage Andromeda]AGY47206.1 tail completion protein [Bacillus phage Glittering]